MLINAECVKPNVGQLLLRRRQAGYQAGHSLHHVLELRPPCVREENVGPADPSADTLVAVGQQ